MDTVQSLSLNAKVYTVRQAGFGFVLLICYSRREQDGHIRTLVEITYPLTSLVPLSLHAVLFQKGMNAAHSVTQGT